MIEVMVKLSQDYIMLAEAARLTPKIPKLKGMQKGPDPMCLYTIDGLDEEDEVFFRLKYGVRRNFSD